MTQKPFKHWRWRLCVAAAVLYAFLSGAGCNGKASAIVEETMDIEAYCQTQRQQFHEGVWAPLFVRDCQGCHNSSGFAVLNAKSRLVLWPETYPNAAQKNLDAMAALAKEKVNGTSLLLAKVSNEIPHGGDTVYAKGSAKYAQLQNFIAELESKSASAPSCTNVVARMDARLKAMRLMEPQATFRKAAINIAGRLPTAEEDARLAQSPEQLEGLLKALLEEEAFYERLKEIFNDIFVFSVRGQRWFDIHFFRSKDLSSKEPYADDFYEDFSGIHGKFRISDGIGKTLQIGDTIQRSLWEEPLALIAYVARNNRPFTEILTANYTVVNDYSAFAYNRGGQPAHLAPSGGWRPIQLWQRVDSPAKTPIPHAGVLSSAAFLAKVPTNSINISRGRAEFVSKHFLATSVLGFAQRPVDSTQLDSGDNPTVNNPTCNACHQHLDGLAGAFAGFSFWNHSSYQPQWTEWNDKKYLPSFQGESFPSRAPENLKPLPWVAQRVAADARFPYAMVRRVFEGITGRKPLEYPKETAGPDYAERLLAWESQNAFLHEVAAHMAQQGMNVKVAFLDILQSPYFRAAQDAALPEALAIGLGEGRLLTPEMLSRKIRATLGTHWGGFYQAMPNESLTGEYNVLYGGIHPSESNVRLTQINTAMAGTASAMARAMACRIPAWEFSKSPHERVVFTSVQKDTQPLRKDSPDGPFVADTQGEAAIRQNLAFLHQRLLGENVSPHSAEVDLSYSIFVEAWRERAENKEDYIQYWHCLGKWDLNGPNVDGNYYADLPDVQQIDKDTHFTLYAWTATLTYLLADFRFIHE